MTDFILTLLRAWDGGGALALMGLGLLGFLWCFLRWLWVEREHTLVLLHNRFNGVTRWLLLHRRSPKTLPVSLVLLVLGVAMYLAAPQRAFCHWAFQNGALFLGLHAVLVILALVTWLSWNREPKYVKSGEGRPDAHFRDVPEEWGDTLVEDGKRQRDPRPTAEILVHRSPTKLARRIVAGGQRFAGNLTLLAFRWDILSRHVFVVGPQGSGKTASLYAPVMHSSQVPWVYQDSKAELPFQEQFPDRPVFGLDVRGHETRSEVWNPMEEIRSSEDFDLILDYLFPSDPNDKNKWIRDMSRVLFGVLLRLQRCLRQANNNHHSAALISSRAQGEAMSKQSQHLIYLLAADSPIPIGSSLPLKKNIRAKLVPIAEILCEARDSGLAEDVWVYHVDAVCALLDISKTTLYRLFRAEKLKARVMGGATVVLRDDLLAYMRSLPHLRLAELQQEASQSDPEEAR